MFKRAIVQETLNESDFVGKSMSKYAVEKRVNSLL